MSVSIIEHGSDDNRYVSIIKLIVDRLRYMYTRVFFFKLAINYTFGGYGALKCLSLQEQSGAESPDATGYTGLITAITAKILSHSGRTPALFILLFVTSRAITPLNVKIKRDNKTGL